MTREEALAQVRGMWERAAADGYRHTMDVFADELLAVSCNHKPLWKISYEAGYLGGIAIVTADTADEALEELRKDVTSFGANNAVVKRILVIGNVARVIYNDNGDY